MGLSKEPKTDYEKLLFLKAFVKQMERDHKELLSLIKQQQEYIVKLENEKKLVKGDLKQFRKDKYIQGLLEKTKKQEKEIEKLIIKLNEKK